MTDLGFALRVELKNLIQMLPQWELHAQLCLKQFQATNDANDFITFMESYAKWKYMRERMEWITELLETCPDE